MICSRVHQQRADAVLGALGCAGTVADGEGREDGKQDERGAVVLQQQLGAAAVPAAPTRASLMKVPASPASAPKR